MATYCVGDLHGRYDLFTILLDEISFDPKKDHLYILGDVIDRNYGGIKIIDYVMSHSNCCTLLMGNHESQFLYMEKAYDVIMFNSELKESMKNLISIYSSNLFNKIEEDFCRKLSAKCKEDILSSPKIKEWLNTGNLKVRKRLLDSMVNLVELINYDKDKYGKVKWVLSNMFGMFETKQFVKELLEQSSERYNTIKDFLKSSPKYISLDVTNRHFELSHSRYTINTKDVFYWLKFPHASSENTYYVFGHNPVPLIHSKISHRFDFDYYSIFSYIDIQNNRYYNLDVSSNPIAALRLEDMMEFYAYYSSDRYATKKNTFREKILDLSKCGYITVETNNCNNDTQIAKRCTLITYRDNCYEYIIYIDIKKKEINYTRVDWLDYRDLFVIENWYDSQTIPEIIQKVSEHFTEQLLLPEIQNLNQNLYSKI